MSNKLFKKSGKYTATLDVGTDWKRITIYEEAIDAFDNRYHKEIQKIFDHEFLFNYLEALIFERTKGKVVGALTH